MADVQLNTRGSSVLTALLTVDGSGSGLNADLVDGLHASSFVTSANPTFTGTVTIPDGALAIADTSGLQAALDAKAPLASPTFSGTIDLTGGSLIDYTQPHVSGVTGTLTQAAHGGRAVLATGTITVPITNGFICLIRNKSGANRTVQPASGTLIHDGAAVASIVLPNNRSLAVHGDGTDVWADGAIA